MSSKNKSGNVQKTDKKHKKKHHQHSKHFVYSGQMSATPFYKKKSISSQHNESEWKKKEIYSNHEKYESSRINEGELDDEMIQKLIAERKERKLEYLQTLIRMHSMIKPDPNDHEWFLERTDEDSNDAFHLDLTGVMDQNWMEFDINLDEEQIEDEIFNSLVDDSSVNSIDRVDIETGIENKSENIIELKRDLENEINVEKEEKIFAQDSSVHNLEKQRNDQQMIGSESISKNVMHTKDQLSPQANVIKDEFFMNTINIPKEKIEKKKVDNTASDDLDDLDLLLSESKLETSHTHLNNSLPKTSIRVVEDIDDFLDNL